MKNIILSAIFLSGAAASSSAHALDTNKMLAISQKVMEIFVTSHDLNQLDGLLAEKSEITLKVNGKTFKRNKKDYLENLKNAFSKNIQSIKLLNVSFEVTSPTTVQIKEQSIHHRKGTGLEESTAGIYYINDIGSYTFSMENEDLKISHLEHSYTKTKL